MVPQIFESELKCHVSVDEETALNLMADAVREEQAQVTFMEEGLGCTETGSVIEEVIAIDMDKTGKKTIASKTTR